MLDNDSCINNCRNYFGLFNYESIYILIEVLL